MSKSMKTKLINEEKTKKSSDKIYSDNSDRDNEIDH